MEIRNPIFLEGDEVRFLDADMPGTYRIHSIIGFDIRLDSFLYELEPVSLDAVSYDLDQINEQELTAASESAGVNAPRSVWELKEGDSYFYADGIGNMIEETFKEDRDPLVKRMFGNVFLTQKEAAQDLLRRLVETNLLKLGGRRWYDPHKDNYYITYDYVNHSIVYMWSRMSCMQGTIFFNSEQEAEEAVAKIGKQQIKKALFGVDE